MSEYQAFECGVPAVWPECPEGVCGVPTAWPEWPEGVPYPTKSVLPTLIMLPPKVPEVPRIFIPGSVLRDALQGNQLAALAAAAALAEAPEFEAPEFEAPELEAPEFEAPEFEAPEFEAQEFEAQEFEFEAQEFDAQAYTAPLRISTRIRTRTHRLIEEM